MFVHRHRHPTFCSPQQAPLGPVEIDWSHPLSAKLISFPHFTGVGLPRDLVDGVAFTQVSGSSAVWEWGMPTSPNTMSGVRPGPLINFNDDIQEHFTRTLPPSRQFQTMNALTVAGAGWYVQDGGNFSYGLFGIHNATDHRAEIGHWNFGGAGKLGGYMRQYADGSTDIRLGSGDNEWHIGVLSSEAGRQAVTVDGVLLGTDTVDYDDTSRTYSVVKIGVVRSAQAINYGALWNRTLSDDEAKWVCAEPWAFLRPRRVRRYSFPAAGGGFTATIAQTVPILTQAAVAERSFHADIDQTLQALDQAAVANEDESFPMVQSVAETSFATEVTDHAVNIPSGDVGDLLLVFIGVTDAGETGSIPGMSTPGGWTTQWNSSFFNATSATDLRVCKRIADGTEGSTVTFSSTRACAGAAQCYRIKNWFGNLVAGVSSGALGSGTSSAPNPQGVTPSWGAKNTLWIAHGFNVDDDVALTAYPANYTHGYNTLSGAGADSSASVFTAIRKLNTTTEDPGAGTLASSAKWIAATVAVRPPDFEGASVLQPVTQAVIASISNFSATISQTLAAIEQSVTADTDFLATITQTLAAINQAAVAESEFAATVAQTLATIQQTAVAQTPFYGSIAQTLPSLSQAVVAERQFHAVVAQTLAALEQAAEASASNFDATIAQTLATIEQAVVAARSRVHVFAGVGTLTATGTRSSTVVSEPRFEPYTVVAPPETNDLRDLVTWAYSELQKIVEATTFRDFAQNNVLHVEPTKPRNGMIVYADGTDWNPGSGEGFYGYSNGSWAKLH